MDSARLFLENTRIFEGHCPKWVEENVSGEVVFTTGMTGYTETLTDPSFAGQILVFTFPLIGNYGVGDASLWESCKIHVKAVVLSQRCMHWSHHTGLSSLEEWLKSFKIPLLTGVDTRELTKVLRLHGTMRGVISRDYSTLIDFPEDHQLVQAVSPRVPKLYGEGSKRVIAVDCGMKESMMRQLLSLGVEVLRVPSDYDYSEERFDGVFLSNGPGDPEDCQKTITILSRVMQRKLPIYGVCLGNQLLALASGAKTYKLKFGHRGQNQPCMHLESGRCYITSQNHSYAIDEKTLSPEWQVTFRNLNDQSVEGICHRTLPFHSVQFHPEACPGPTDTRWFFKQFVEAL